MSELLIGLVAEGKTDMIIIEAALRSVFENRPFILSLLQPESSAPFGGAGQHGGGWGGVYKWCQQHLSMRDQTGINPSLSGFDLILLHVDADVADENYQNAGINNDLIDLPCSTPCPPAADSVNALRQVLYHWLDITAEAIPRNWVFCVPSICSEAWLVAGLYHQRVPEILDNIECNSALVTWLSQRPVREGRLVQGEKKRPSSYREKAPMITAAWNDICGHCTQAQRFDYEVRAVFD